MNDQQSATSGRPPKRTRTSASWGAISLGLAALIIALVFALQNHQSVEVTFLGMHGDLPLVILLLLVAVLGALIIFALGAGRFVQLRSELRRSRRET